MRHRRLGVALIGAGRAGMIHAHNYRSRLPHARLAAIVEPVAETRARAAGELELEEGQVYAALPDALADDAVDAVVIVTPTNLHRETAIAAARAGKHVFCEKPMAMDAAECREMIEAAEAARVKLQIGFMRRFDHSFAAAHRAIRDGAIGNVVQVKSVTHGPSTPQRWMYDIHASNGPLAEVNSHDIDTARWLTGSELTEVYAVGGNFRCTEVAAEYPDFYDTVLLTGRFRNGAQCLIDGAVAVRYGYDARAEILGTEGILMVGSVGDASFQICGPDGSITQRATSSWRGLFADAYLEEDRSFVDAILEDRETEVTGRDGLEAVRVVNAGNRSLTERRPVQMGEV
jgi:myo-inositol 2-dehydrogenase / D-chiro-inositol 1-dehydrogenase